MNLEILEQYKDFLDYGTNQSLGYDDASISRYATFKMCASKLADKSDINILELGTCRSFVDGRFEGCNLDDAKYWRADDPNYWDWGAGCFILIFGQIFRGKDLTTVDLAQSHINRSKIMTDSLGIQCEHVVSDSLGFLSNTNKKYDLIYVDTGDMWPIEPTAKLQLDECRIIFERDLIKPGGLLLIDDVLNKTPREFGDDSAFGKSKYSMDYLISTEAYDLEFKGYQYLMKRKENG